MSSNVRARKLLKRAKSYVSMSYFRDRALLARSSLFDSAWYAQIYPDVTQAGVHPIDHYLRTGYLENRAPGPNFDPIYYLNTNPDVARANLNPLVHYLRYGQRERRPIQARGLGSSPLISQSPLFDEQWYLNQYPDVRESGMGALEHYLQHGWRAGRSPGPLFDSADYLKRHPDVAASGKEPLSQFLEFGSQEERFAQSGFYEPLADRWGESKPVPLLHKPSEQLTIAVAVHVFYLDVFEEICSYLKNIPYHFNLLITTPDPANESPIRSIVSRSGIDATLFLKISQNRGRNFGPLLVEYSGLLLHHDLFLHLHTKKSLHSGSDAFAWRAHLYKSLLGNRYLVSAIIDRFANDNTGVLFPATYSWLPYWAHHWLSNSHLIKPFYERLGIPYERPLTYLDYPVGSMFWARPEALKPLLEEKWRYEDFPPEQGQNDGTVAHVIERSIVTIAKHEKYSFIEFDYDAGSFRRNWSRKNLYQYAGRTPEDLKTRIRANDVISFDIFDTLLTRTVLTPDALQQFTGWLLGQRNPALESFFAVRKQSEELARKRRNYEGDVNLDEIYRTFPNTAAWDEDTIASAKQLEIELENRAFCVRKDVVEALSYARSVGKRVVAVSDTYFSRTFIESLLRSFGLLEFFDEIYLSSECGKRKDRGDMWDFLLSAEQLNSRRMLHIGDNEHSDAQLPGDRRIETFHVMSPATLMAQSGFEIPAKRTWTTDIALGPVAARFFNSPFLPNRSFRPFAVSTPHEFGYLVFGPLLFGFFSWLLTHPALKVLDRLYFLSREGYFLHRLYKKLQQLPGIEAPPASYLYASRRAAISAAQSLKFDPAEITFGSGFQGTISELLKTRIGLELPPEFELDETKIVLPDDAAYVEEMLRILESNIVEHARKELDALRQYCAEAGLMAASRIGLVDVGYSGSIQKALQTVLGKPMAGLYLATVEHAARVEEGDGIACGCFADRDTFATTGCAALRDCRILEAFLTAPHGQVLRFEIQNGQTVPVFKREGLSQSAFSSLLDIYEGISSYFDDLIHAFGPDVFLIAPDLSDSQITFKALVQHGVVVSGRIADVLYLEDDYCGNSELAAGNLAIDEIQKLQVAV